MDEYLHAVRANLLLAEQTLRAREAWQERQPKGMLFNSNRAAHTTALLAMVRETRRMTNLNDDGWWEKDEELPF